MKLSISNIGWTQENDEIMYSLIKKYGYVGLEIAPTRIFPQKPYDNLERAKKWTEDLYEKYHLIVPSMQSIWYGRQEKIFGSIEERNALLEYTKKTIQFAHAIGCKNIVFGCPQNRNLPEGENSEIAINFFKTLGDYAASLGTVIGMEANPAIYHTNYINDTLSALELIKKVDSKGFLLNLDLGTVIQNKEDISEIIHRVKYINHIHISEPGLKIIEKRKLHQELKEILLKENYEKFVSIEMGKNDDLLEIEKIIQYVGEVFNG